MYLVLNFKSNLGTYGHNFLAYERDARGANLLPGANCAHENGFRKHKMIAHHSFVSNGMYSQNRVNHISSVRIGSLAAPRPLRKHDYATNSDFSQL